MGLWQNVKRRLVASELRTMSLEDLLLSAGLRGDNITTEKAMQIPAVAMGVNLIANTVSMLPIKLYQEEEGEQTHEIKGDTRTFLLNDETGGTLDGFQFKSAMTRSLLLNGKAYAYIEKQKNDIKAIKFIPPGSVSIVQNFDVINRAYEIYVQGKKYRDFQFLQMYRNSEDGLNGKGIVEENSSVLATAYSTMLYENKQAKTGGTKKGFLQSESKLEQSAIDELKKSWNKLYSGENSSNAIVLNRGVTFKEATETSAEMQLNERKITNSNEISKILNVPLGLLEGKYNDDAYVTMIKLAVSPILVLFATALNKYLLTEREKQEGKYFAFDDKELLKGDTLKRYQAYALGIKNGFLQIDDVRYQENLAPLELDFIRLGLQDVLYYPDTKEIYTPNTGLKASVEGGGDNQDGNAP